jgi:serine/threonine protein kinase
MDRKAMDAAANDASNQQSEPAKPRIGRYVVDRLLDRGGMAEVFLGKALGPAGFSKRVVIKRILPHLAEDESFVTMFLNEARLVALLEHPNIAQVFDFGQHSETYYIAMEYVEGESLRTILKYYKACRQPLPLTPALAWVQNVCEGLAYAHNLKDETGKSQNIVHRDISPENILISKAGTAKVVDFGIAKAAVNPQITGAGEVRGKLSYIAPEQISGASVDRRADIYSLGVTLYEVLSGERPYTGSNQLELLYSILNSEPAALHKIRPDIDPAFSAIVSRAIARDPNQRYPDMQAFYSEIDDYRNSHSLRVKSSELADIVAQVEKWSPKAKGAGMGSNSVGSLSLPKSSLVPCHTGESPEGPERRPPLPATGAPGSAPRAAGTPLGRSIERPLPLRAVGTSGPVPIRQGSGAPPESVHEKAPRTAAMHREAAPRKRGRIALVALLGAATIIPGVTLVAIRSTGFTTADVQPAPEPGVDLSEPTQPTVRKMFVPSISLVPERVETPQAPEPSPALASPGPAPRQRRAAKAPPSVAVRATPAPRPRGAPPPASNPTLATPEPSSPRPEPPAAAGPPATVAAETPSGPPVVAEDGWLNLRTEPWCEVYYRGELVGTTPINRMVFPAGKHSLRLVNKSMGIEENVVVEVRPGQESTARLNLNGG